MTFARIVGIRPGEFRPTAAMFSLLGLIIATSYILKPVRSSIFLTEFGADRLPYAYMLIGAVLAFVASAFSRIVARFTLNRVFTGASLFFAVNLVLFWWAIGSGWPYVPYVFYVWVSVFTIVMPTLFWLLANYVFYPNEGAPALQHRDRRRPTGLHRRRRADLLFGPIHRNCRSLAMRSRYPPDRRRAGGANTPRGKRPPIGKIRRIASPRKRGHWPSRDRERSSSSLALAISDSSP